MSRIQQLSIFVMAILIRWNTPLALTADQVQTELVQPKGKREPYDWIDPMRALTRDFKGTDGKVLRLGDSITYANPSSSYLRYGKDRSPEQLAVCRWMKADIRDKSSGIWLSFDDQPSGRSHTAASGVTTAQFLEGGKGGLPKLDDIIRLHNPQVACVLLGTNDLNSQTSEVFAKNLESIIVKLLANKTIPVITTVPPGVGKMLSCCNTTSLFGSSAKNTKSQLSITTVRL